MRRSLSRAPTQVRKTGQNTAEFLIILTLVVTGSISLLTIYSATINAKFAVVSSYLSGSEAQVHVARDVTSAIANDAIIRASQGDMKMEGVEAEELSYGLLPSP